MDYVSHPLEQKREEATNHMLPEKLEEQLTVLTEWKLKAIVQLEYFQTACKLYNFCDADEVSELLKN